ncbi:MAG: type II toxin-antitoxin system VapC family toxin [Thermoanaerobaculaceae bacterium]
MIVVDASAVLELLLGTAIAPRVTARLLDQAESLHAPHLLDIEVAQVLRRFAAAGELTATRGREALDDLDALPITRYPHNILLPRIWELRANLTAYDAAYVALAEALDAPLLTTDARLARAPGHRARVELM